MAAITPTKHEYNSKSVDQETAIQQLAADVKNLFHKKEAGDITCSFKDGSFMQVTVEDPNNNRAPVNLIIKGLSIKAFELTRNAVQDVIPTLYCLKSIVENLET